MIDHKYLQQGDNKMRLNEIAEDVQRHLIKRNNAETAKQKAAYARSAQSWLEMKMAEANAQKARQRFIQAAVASSLSRGYQPY